MLNKLQMILKRIVIGVTCIATVSSALISTIPVAYAAGVGSSNILGTNAALGSPILNNNFTIDNWNKWEMVCWGVFLSNFCQPLIDDYHTAFQATGEGSDGSGYKALVFGSGNDTTNNETIESLCDYAISQSTTVSKEILVAYTPIENAALGEKPDPNVDEACVRSANFNDLFFAFKEDGVVSPDTTGIGNTWAEISTGALDSSLWIFPGNGEYTDVVSPNKGSVPTFYIKNGDGKYVVLWDYTDAWDVQMISAMINSVRQGTDVTGKNYLDAFQEAFDNFTEQNPTIRMDAFGNITVNSKIVIPAAVNKNLTTDGKITLINSWVMNSYASTYSEQQLILGLKQNTISVLPGLDGTSGAEVLSSKRSGYPAFGGSEIGSVGLLYFDSDSVFAKDAIDGVNDLAYGDIVQELYACDINSNKNKYTLKFEIANNGIAGYHGVFSPTHVDTLDLTRFMSSMLPNILEGTGTVSKDTLTYIVNQQGNKIPLFSSNGVIIASQLKTSKPNKEATNEGAVRNFYNFIFKLYKGDITETTEGYYSRSTLVNKLSGITFGEFKQLASDLWAYFKSSNPTYKDIKNLTTDWAEFIDYGNNETVASETSRMTLVYPVSDEIRAISSILGLANGTEFSTYSTMIYMTYLDWFGISNNTSITGATSSTSEFNPEIFDESTDDILNVDVSSLISAKSDEQLEEEVLQYSYLMLHPEQGRDYRLSLIQNGAADFIYEQYNRIVYGGYDETYSGSASKSNSGFLAVEPFADNVLTAWFINSYVDIAVWIIMICCILIVIIGLMKSKRISWYFLSLCVVINVVLIVPSSGEITPYITSGIVQSMFSSKMTYWSVSQGITNASLEAQASTGSSSMSGLTSEAAQAVLGVIKQLGNVYTDRSLMVKQDISQKVTQTTAGAYADIQSLQSARWVLPMVMQQFSSDDKSANYIYKPLANIWDDLSNMYWFYSPSDAESVNAQSPTATSGQNATATTIDVDNVYNQRSQYLPDLKEHSAISTDVNYKCYSYTLHGEEKEQIHLYAYFLPSTTTNINTTRESVFGAGAENYVDVDSWQDFIDSSIMSVTKANWQTDKDGGFEATADSYDRTDRSSITRDMSYLLHTESPIYYFYNVVKDTFPTDSTLGLIIGRLQGTIEENEEGEEVRNNFMYATKGAEYDTTSATISGLEYTGYVRDLLDLEELFKNTVPYLYEMQLIAGGFDGESGVLVDDEGEALEITDELQYYEGEKQSWMYRCNWATKLMENPDYSKSTNIRITDDGDLVTITNQMLPECYEAAGREMVFSEAQMEAMGLKERDLSLVELKCIEVNKDVAKQWTLLINYAGTQGLTKEVLLRQMATDATMIFSKEFSSAGILNTMYAMYPQSLDLRYISFDSVMKMLIMNVSKNTSYIYGDTMSTLIEETDLLTACLLLISAFLAAYIIPFIRNILTAMIFYLGFFAILRALFSSAKFKVQVAGGQVISNLVFAGCTIAYYSIFAALMSISASDEVLSTSTITSEAGNPVWVLLAVILASMAYIFCMYKMICFCFAHYRDMGYEVYSTMASGIVSKLSDSMGGIGSSISNFFGGDTNATSNTNSIKGTGARNGEATDVNIKNANNGTLTISQEDETKDNVLMDDYNNNYNNLDDVDAIEVAEVSDINATIDAGSKMGDIDS